MTPPRPYRGVGPGTSRPGHTSFGINYGSISFGQLSGYIVFCSVPLLGGEALPHMRKILCRREGKLFLVQEGRKTISRVFPSPRAQETVSPPPPLLYTPAEVQYPLCFPPLLH